MKEEFRNIVGYEGLYQVSNLGNIKSLERTKTNHSKYQLVNGRILKSSINHKGYVYVILYKNNKQKGYLVHRLVAEAFIPNPENKPQVNHIDGNKLNNHVSNLEWVSQQENMQHALSNGLKMTKPIYQYDKEGNLIKIWNSIREIQRTLNIPSSLIIRCCKGERKSSHNYIWKYKDI